MVVIAIIGILIGLLLPAVQAAREAARRMQCTNNLKQIGLGLQNHHDVKGTLPPAYYTHADIDGTLYESKAWGWGTALLPYMEQTAIYDQLSASTEEFNAVCPDENTGNWNAQVVEAMRTSIDAFRCPSDTATDKINSAQDFDGVSDKKYHPAVGNYIAVVGVCCLNYNNNNYQKEHGAVVPLKGIGLQHITDGTSNTLAIGERCTTHEAAYWVGPGTLYAGDAEGANTASKVCSRARDVRINHPVGSGRYYMATASEHAGGVNFVFCDGSVRFLSETIEFNNGKTLDGGNAGWNTPFEKLDKTTLGTYQLLVARDDGQPVSL